MEKIQSAFEKLDRFVTQNDYKGWDPFDGLNASIFNKSIFYHSELSRLIWIQLLKHSPINFRPLAGVPKMHNAKGLGLFCSGLIHCKRLDEADRLLKRLHTMMYSGYQGNCWGYNFDWQARAFYVPKGKPNIVTSVFVANAFLDYYDATKDDNSLNTGKDTCEFILNHLIQYEDSDTLCFAYIPGENARVHNANMLGAELLARVYFYTKKEVFLEKSRKAMAYSMAALNPDYSWPYGELHHHQFIDNFHTGFNLVALKNWMDFTGEKCWEEQLIYAYRYFMNTFWMENGCPKYYHNSLYPIDIHCSAQGIVTCLKLSEFFPESILSAEKILQWAIEHMMDKKGFFYYQKTRYYTNKIPYIRWSQAWMFYALSLYLKYRNE